MNTSLITKLLDYSRRFLAGTLFRYTTQIISKAWIALVCATGMRPLFKMVVLYLFVNHIRNLFEIMSTGEDYNAPNGWEDAVEEASCSVLEKKEVGTAVRGRSAIVEVSLQKVFYHYQKHTASVLTNIVLHTVQT